MAFNGSGTFNRIYNWVTDKANGFKITASRVDGEFDGMATGLSNCITKDGQTTISANIPLNSFKLTGLGSGTARTDVINVGQVQDNQFLYLGTTSGSADAYTLAPSPAITAYTATQQFTAKISATNLTTTPYLQVSSIASPTTTAVIKKLSATKTEIAVEASDLLINGIYDFKRNSANDAWIVLNPEKAFYNLTNGINYNSKATTTTQGIAFLSNPITISNNATDANNDIDFSAGNFQFSDGSGQATYAGGTGQLDVLFGTGNGMLATGSKAINSTYHLYMVSNLTTGVSKPLAILGVAGTAPDPTSVLPSGFTKFEDRGSILTDGSGNIRPFTQDKKYFTLTTPVLSQSLTLTANTRGSYAITTPLGKRTNANILGTNVKNSSGNSQTWISDLNTTDIDPVLISGFETIKGNMTYVSDNEIWRKTNLTSQIGIRTNNSTSSTEIKIVTMGWEDINLKF